MSYTRKQMEEYQRIEHKFLELFYQYPKVTSTEIRSLLDKLHRYEKTLHRIAENDCNGHPRMKTEYRDGKTYRYEVEDLEWTQRDEKKEKSIQEKVIALLKPYNIEVRFNGDPRGGYIRMLLPDHSSNGWDGESWGIYW
jgi:hypothetical protein